MQVAEHTGRGMVEGEHNQDGARGQEEKHAPFMPQQKVFENHIGRSQLGF
jgi:hypothetical protein